MRYEEIVSQVSQRAGLFEGEAVAVTRATLATLAECISGEQASELAARLPGPLQDALLPTKDEAEVFSFEEFVNRVAARSRLDPAVSETAVAVVMATLREAVTSGEFDDVLSQLPNDFHRLGAH